MSHEIREQKSHHKYCNSIKCVDKTGKQITNDDIDNEESCKGISFLRNR